MKARGKTRNQYGSSNSRSALSSDLKKSNSPRLPTPRSQQGNRENEHVQTPLMRLDLRKVEDASESQGGSRNDPKSFTSRISREVSSPRKTSTAGGFHTSRGMDSVSEKRRLFCSPSKSDKSCPGSARKSIEPDQVQDIILRLDQNKKSLREAFLLLDRDRDGFISYRDWKEGIQKLDTTRRVEAENMSGQALTFREFSKIADDCIDKSKFRQCAAPFLNWNPSQQYLRMWAREKPPRLEVPAESTPRREFNVLEATESVEGDAREKRRERIVMEWEQRFDSARKQVAEKMRERGEMKRLTEIAKEDGMVARIKREQEAQARFFKEFCNSIPPSITKPYAPEIHMLEFANATSQWYKGLGNAGSSSKHRMKMQ